MQKRITIFVVALHFGLIGFLFFSPPKKQIATAKHLVVRTEKLRPTTKAASVAAHRPAQKPASSKPLSSINPKKPAAKAPAAGAKKTTKKPLVNEKGKSKPPPKQTPIPEEKEFEADAKIEAKKRNVYPSVQLDVPKQIESLAIDRSEKTANFEIVSDDANVLVAYLHESLHLPDYGEVKIRLTIREDGSVAELAVLKAESAKNKAYLERNLPLLKFSCLERKEQTFVFTFCNEL